MFKKILQNKFVRVLIATGWLKSTSFLKRSELQPGAKWDIFLYGCTDSYNYTTAAGY